MKNEIEINLFFISAVLKSLIYLVIAISKTSAQTFYKNYL